MMHQLKNKPTMLGQKGVIQFVVLAIILGGIVVGVYLVTSGPLKLFPRAVSAPISGPISGPILPSPTPSTTPTSTPSTTLTVTPTTISRTSTITVTWSGIPNPNLRDYINFLSPDNTRQVAAHTYWINNNCTWFSPSSGNPQASGSCTIDLSRETIDSGISTFHLVLYSGATPGVSTIIVGSNNITFTSIPSPTPIPTPIPRIITQFKFAENPYDLQYASWQDYSSGIVVSHTFTDSSLGLKFIFVQFRDDQDKIVQINGQDYISSSIELIEETVSPSPTSTKGGGSTSGGGTSGGGISGPSIPWPFSLIVPSPQSIPTPEYVSPPVYNTPEQTLEPEEQPAEEESSPTEGQQTGLAGPGWYCDVEGGNTSYFYVDENGIEGKTTNCGEGEVCKPQETPGYAADAICEAP